MGLDVGGGFLAGGIAFYTIFSFIWGGDVLGCVVQITRIIGDNYVFKRSN